MTPEGTHPTPGRVLVSRQPICRKDLAVFGYELLFRDGLSDRATFADGARATAQVMAAALMDIGLDTLVGSRLGFINFERQLLMDSHCESLPPSRVILEILETVQPDAALLKRLEQLRARGYRFALDDFACTELYTPLLQFADFVKVDLVASDWPAIDRALSVLGKYPVEFIAEKVESGEQLERCDKLGFRYFQGYFFCRPRNISAKTLPSNRLSSLHLLAQLNKPDVRVEEVEGLISQDVSLSFRLLRYINSAMCSLERRVESIRHAMVMVGLQKMRIWASLMVFSGFGDTPQEIIVTGAQRGRMCELLAVALRLPHPETSFLVGIFSVLDVILDRRMEQVLSLLSLTDEIKDALLSQKGELGAVLRCVAAYERRDWDEVRGCISLPYEVIEKAYREAVSWTATMAAQLSSQSL